MKSEELLELLCYAREDDEHFFGGSDGHLLYTFFACLSSNLKSWEPAFFLLALERNLNGSNSIAVVMGKGGIESREERGTLRRTIVSRGLCPRSFFPFHFFPLLFSLLVHNNSAQLVGNP